MKRGKVFINKGNQGQGNAIIQHEVVPEENVKTLMQLNMKWHCINKDWDCHNCSISYRVSWTYEGRKLKQKWSRKKKQDNERHRSNVTWKETGVNCVKCQAEVSNNSVDYPNQDNKTTSQTSTRKIYFSSCLRIVDTKLFSKPKEIQFTIPQVKPEPENDLTFFLERMI